jgi:Sec7-like guanine-nucleotide exchange factor
MKMDQKLYSGLRLGLCYHLIFSLILLETDCFNDRN